MHTFFEELIGMLHYKEFVLDLEKKMEDQLYFLDDLDTLCSHWKFLKMLENKPDKGLTF